MQNSLVYDKFNHMKKPLWSFTNSIGAFVSNNADKVKSLYFPLCNHSPIMSSITPDLHGDIKTGYHSFLLEPVSRINLANSRASRNFWIYINKDQYWSATGVSKDTAYSKYDEFELSCGLLWHKVIRMNKEVGLKAEITSFAPAQPDPIEIMSVKITNISSRTIKFTPTAAIPLYCRSADNLRDHRHVTSLLQRIELHKFGIIVKPTLCFDEAGHRINQNFYFAFGLGEKTTPPAYIYPTQENFSGESNLEAPDAVIKESSPDKNNYQGKEPMAGFKFKAKTLKPKEECEYTVILGIANNKQDTDSLLNKYSQPKNVAASLDETISFWQKQSANISVGTTDKNFDRWLRWVSIQPVLRKIFGCSFLPDFDYGKGGRGWRDLWQDCLSLILNNPEEVRPTLLNNFKGVRINGTNATIIDSKPGEFVADRNNLPRVWMDHGVWPLVTTNLYIQQTGDLNILLEEETYFNDLPTQSNYKGTILEHLILQNLAQFFNAGPHNNIRLEGADWNDGLDMAREFGESVAFSCMYAQNLDILCELIKKIDTEKIQLLKEAALLLEYNIESADYNDFRAKKQLLEKYFEALKSSASGEKIALDKDFLLESLRRKSEWLKNHIRTQEWLKEGFFNGYYDNQSRRVEGNMDGLMRMTLTGQVFPVMSGIADQGKIESLFINAKKYLQDKKLGGFHLNTDFKQEQHNLGRAFSFVYGDKENGAFFNHMSIMFAYALYKQNFVPQAFEVFSSVYKMALNTQKSQIYPCLPEYFNAQGQGMYSYLTGSASWFMLTLLTQVFGVRGEYGDLLIEPKINKEWFTKSGEAKISSNFAGKRIETIFLNPKRKSFGEFYISQAVVNGKDLAVQPNKTSILIPRKTFLSLCNQELNTIEITLS